MLRNSILAILILLSLRVSASGLNNDFAQWSTIYLHGPITEDKLDWDLELSTRLHDHMSDFRQQVVGPSIEYKLDETWSLLKGFKWNTNSNLDTVYENRPWQGVKHKYKFGKWQMENKFRIEERFLRDDFAIRLRHKIQFKRELNQDWSFVTFEELFVSPFENDSFAPSALAGNRFFLGLEHKFSEHLGVTGGYQMQYVNRATASDDSLQHIAFVIANISF